VRERDIQRSEVVEEEAPRLTDAIAEPVSA
jgi:hypothetical protein